MRRRLTFYDESDPPQVVSQVICCDVTASIRVGACEKRADEIVKGDHYRWPDGQFKVVGLVESSSDDGQTWEEVS